MLVFLMKGVILSLLLMLALSSFVVAGSISEVRADFIVNGVGFNTDSREQNYVPLSGGFEDYFFEGIIAILIFSILIVFFKRVVRRKNRKPKKIQRVRRRK